MISNSNINYRTGCQAIAHLAAPVSLSFKDPVPVLHGAIVGTQTLLDSALSHGKDLKSVVLMSSIVAIINPNAPPAPGSVPHVLNEADWNTTSEEAVAKLGGNAASIDIYAASKTAAEKTFWKFRDEKNPGFTMSAVNPALVGGPPLIMPEKAEGINETVIHIWTILSGAEIPPTKGTMVDVRDVGRLLVFAVQHPEKADGQRYLASSAMGTNEAVSDILKEAYPDRKDIIKGGVGKVWEDKDFDISGGLDVSKAVNAMGRPFVGFKESVLDAAKSFERYL